MAILEPTIPSGSTATKQNNPTPMQTKVVVNVDTPIIKSTSYIGGSNWRIKSYYNQILGDSDTASNFDPLLPLNEQQYDRIDNMTLSVVNPLEIGALNLLSGTSLLSGIKPYIGDVIVVDIESERPGMFRVTEVETMNSALNRVYQITYVLDTTYETDSERFIAIETAVTRVFVYDDTALLSMSDPILLTDDYALKRKLEEEINFISENYISDFLNTRGVLVSQDKIYDGYATSFFLQLYSGMNNIDIARRGFNLNNTVYDMLLEQRAGMVSNLGKIGMISSSDALFKNQGRLGEIRTASDKQIVSKNSTPPITTTTLDILPVAEDYLFTTTFLTDLTGVSLLETMLNTYIHRDYLKKNDLLKVIEKYAIFTAEERYFYTPIIILLYKYAIAKTFSRR